MQTVTRQIAFEPASWTDARRAELARLFDGLAPSWPTADEIAVEAPLLDACDRGLPHAPRAERRRLCDLGGGNGRATRHLVERFPVTFITDLSLEMLRRIPPGLAPAVRADAACLPFADHTIDVLVCTNMFLFPAEAARVLAGNGVLVWVNSWGPATPIHLSSTEVDAALPGDWDGVASGHGEATWSLHWRHR